MRAGTTATRMWAMKGGQSEARPDQLATEEPLEIRLAWDDGEDGGERTVAVTMRTPGSDEELAAGFLFAEGVIDRSERIVGFRRPVESGDAPEPNVMEVELAEAPEADLPSLERHFFSNSACGVCGKAGLQALQLRAPGRLPPGPEVAPAVLSGLPGRLREAQGIFDVTGGLHAAGLFDAAGRLIALREDVGRHNALDKVFGWALLQGLLPLHGHIALVSGRSSYEILQKCLMAGVPVVCAVSAPSSLAVELANRFGITLVGFLRGDRFNVYSGVERLSIQDSEDLAGVCSAPARP